MSAVKVNGIKKITDLTAASTINDADVFMVETTAGSRKVTGATLKTLINNAANAVGDDVDALQSVIAPEFDSTLDYSAGDYVYSEGKLYRFTADHANGALDGTDTVEVTVTSDMVNDVTVNGTSVVSNGIAEIPIGTSSTLGVVSSNPDGGVAIGVNGKLRTDIASSAHVKAGSNAYKPIVPSKQHESAFYGLAKAAGDTTQSSSANAVGTYTEDAKLAIRNMIDATGESATITVSGTDPVIQASRNARYMCGEVTSIDFTPCASGICEVIFTSGSTLTVLSLPQTVKMPEWFEVEANHVYDISIVDGVYGAVMVW